MWRHLSEVYLAPLLGFSLGFPCTKGVGSSVVSSAPCFLTAAIVADRMLGTIDSCLPDCRKRCAGPRCREAKGFPIPAFKAKGSKKLYGTYIDSQSYAMATLGGACINHAAIWNLWEITCFTPDLHAGLPFLQNSQTPSNSRAQST